MSIIFLVVLCVSVYFLIGSGVYRMDCLILGKSDVIVLIIWPLYCIIAGFIY